VRRDGDAGRRPEAVDLRLFDPVRLVLDRAFPDEPFLLVDLLVREPPLDELRVEDLVVCAIVIAFLGLLAGRAIRSGGAFRYPLS
jgi:hypothetical protein